MNLSVYTENALIEGDISISSLSVKGEALITLLEQKLQSIQDGINGGKLFHISLQRKLPVVAPQKGGPVEVVFFTDCPNDIVSTPKKGVGLLEHGAPVIPNVRSIQITISTEGIPEVEVTYIKGDYTTAFSTEKVLHPVMAFRMMTHQEFTNLVNT